MELREWHEYLIETEWSNGRTHVLKCGGVDPDATLANLEDLNDHQRKWGKPYITKFISIKERYV